MTNKNDFIDLNYLKVFIYSRLGMEDMIEPLGNNDQPIVINSESPCVEFTKCEDVVSLDDRDDKSSDTNSSSLSSIIAEENSIGKYISTSF